jgi:hypothetical protein
MILVDHMLICKKNCLRQFFHFQKKSFRKKSFRKNNKRKKSLLAAQTKFNLE